MSILAGRFIKARRCELGLSQETLATELGVCVRTIGRWEMGRRTLPPEKIEPIESALGLERGALRKRVEHCVQLPASLRLESDVAPLVPLECSVKRMCEVLPGARLLSERVRQQIGDLQYEELDQLLLRQTEWELFLAHSILDDGAVLSWTAPLLEGSRKPVFGEDREYAGHLLWLSLVWQRERERIVFMPQVPIQVAGADAYTYYRVDYLIVHSAPRLAPLTMALELDGSPHPLQKERDAERTAKLPFSVIRFDNRAVCSPNFLHRLFEQIRDKARFGRASSVAYNGYLQERRARYNRAQAV